MYSIRCKYPLFQDENFEKQRVGERTILRKDKWQQQQERKVWYCQKHNIDHVKKKQEEMIKVQ